ncbi:Homoserine/homoserine lactone efflux protein [Candidatus Paraburkholderia kirkii UZHbot1]|uniref:Homoserine/homoserine lactone efflux protein n=1 Tax=Candidatus Paraburkholderia kirkii UZHbot1 TaxID=1055526 RepID=G4MIT1_9BURK|nr:Homoserine/homoserine lactone efflux protein [Candidatus Paraburkholderia kirkii UZHbot1]
MLLVVSYALGDLTAMTASMLGLGVLLAASAELFMVVKWIGAAYLFYLGIKLWRAPVVDTDAVRPTGELRTGRILAHAYAVTTLNPKSIIFLVAFVPHFVDPHAASVSQIAILEATFVGLAAANVFAYALLASGARRAIRKASVQRAVNRTGGALLMSAGVFAATWRKSSMNQPEDSTASARRVYFGLLED